MTIIAVAGDMMLADSMSFRGDVGERIPPGRSKIHRAPDGSLVGAAGYVGDIFALYKWVDAGMNWLCPPKLAFEHKDDDSLDWLHLRLDGTVWRCQASWMPYEIAKPNTIGMNGACYLFEGAMEAGATPIRAMEIAVRRTAFTGGDVHFEHLPKPKPDNAGRNGAWTCLECLSRNHELNRTCLACCMPRR